MPNPPNLKNARWNMVQQQLAARDIRDEKVLDAMRQVPREAFLPRKWQAMAYDDSPLPIGQGQTISQPYMVAFMIQAAGLRGGERVLEIGTGSGYAAAVLSKIAGQVISIERIASLANAARDTLAQLEYRNIRVLCGDGTRGLLEEAPFDAILVAAGGPEVPESLQTQLAIGGKLIIPVGSDQNRQKLLRVTRLANQDYSTEPIASVRFVPLIGEQGWAADPPESELDDPHNP